MAEALIPTILVAGGTPNAREDWILQDLQRALAHRVALLLEGLPAADSGLDRIPELSIRRSSAGCLCCTGNLVLRVNLNRVLRERPGRLYIGLAAGTHASALATMLTAPPYSDWLVLEDTISL